MKPPDIHGYALVSSDDRIADASGAMPEALRNEADWAYFQAELDRAELVVLGRVSHEASPNVKRRRRLVLTRSAPGLERRDETWWWNPEATPWEEVAAQLVSPGGRVAVPGGQGAFEVFLKLGFAGFHLSRLQGLALPGGRGLFAGCETGRRADDILRKADLAPEAPVTIDAAAGVTLTVWRPAKLLSA